MLLQTNFAQKKSCQTTKQGEPFDHASVHIESETSCRPRSRAFHKDSDKLMKNNEAGGCGCSTLGAIIAVVISWSANGSILWAILHGIFGWFYVLYYVLFIH